MKQKNSQILIVNENNQYQVYKTYARTTPVHGHSHFLLMLVLSGTCKQFLNGQLVDLKPGTMIMMSPCDYHYNIVESSKVEYYGIQFDLSFLQTRLGNLTEFNKYPLYGELSKKDSDYVSVLFKLLLSENTLQNKQSSSVFVQSIIELLTIIAFRKCPSVSEQESPNLVIRKALIYIHNHFKEPILISEVARESGYSCSHFSVKFAQIIGVPFQEYISGLRLRNAKNMLTSTDCSITECALNSGFNSVSYFSKLFKKEFNCTPSEARRNKKND